MSTMFAHHLVENLMSKVIKELVFIDCLEDVMKNETRKNNKENQIIFFLFGTRLLL